jgi:hypothetical protein
MDSELLFGQLRTAGIVVDPRWEVDTMTPDSLFTIGYDCAKVVLAPPDARRAIVDALRADHDAAAELKAFTALPAKLPKSTRDRLSTAQQLCVLLEQALGCADVEYNALLYPEPARTKALLQELAQRVGEHAERVAAALAEAEDAAAAAQDDDDDDLGGGAVGGAQRISVQQRVKRSLGQLRKQVSATEAGRGGVRRPDAGAHLDAATGEKSLLPLRAATLHDPAVFGDAKATLVAQLPAQHTSLASLLEYSAAARVGTKSFEADRRRRLTASASNKATRFAKKAAVPTVTDAELAKANAVEHAMTSRDNGRGAAFFGTAEDLDPTLAEARRAEAEAAAAAEAAASAEVAELQGAVEAKREKRTVDEREVYEQLKAAKTRVSDTKAIIKAEKARVKDAQAAIEAAEAKRELQAADWEARRADAEMRQQLILQAADPATLESLDEQIAAANEKREAIAHEFEAKLAKVVRKHAKLRAAADQQAEESQSAVVADLRAVCKALKKTLRAERAEAQALEREWERAPKGIDRSKFARVVTDMSTSLRKQQVQIDDTVRQIHEQQGTIDGTQEKVRATYSGVEESVYEQAKREQFAKEAYPRIIALREAYVSLVDTITNRGKTRREQHVLDARHAKLTKSVAYFNEAGEGVVADLAALQADIKEIEASIAAAQQM